MPMLRWLIYVEGFLNIPASKSAKSIPNQVKSITSHSSTICGHGRTVGMLSIAPDE